MKAIFRATAGWLLLAAWLTTAAPGHAQDSTDTDPNLEAYRAEARDHGDPVAQPAPDDGDTRSLRRFDPARVDRFRRDRDYRYNREPPPADDPIGRFLAWLADKIWGFLQSPAYRNGWRYVLLAGIAGFTFYLLWRADVLPLALGRRSRQVPLNYDLLTDDIHAIDFERAVADAIAGRQYRLAVRLLYLQALKSLTDHSLIDWQPDRTNRYYARQLTGTPYGPAFDALTTRFEYVWYGDFPVDAGQVRALQAEFVQFNTQLTKHFVP
jgi:hypothetical protein